ncbi:hypothetical protein FRC11_010753 [Ceratobasidium sp. 423]|nr:hypothetical protein FRC11_010753 [Ceratobasidium sp. 423]
MDPPLVPQKIALYGEARGLREEWKTQSQDNCDDLGKELHSESPVWKLYVEEAKEQDTELTTGHNKNLDTLLIFATLYSAILTAFLVASGGLLEPDNSEVTVALLLILAQSQWRMETGRPDPTAPPVKIPQFQPPRAARFINILWFTSLILSLGVVMLAMLAKEWLSAFTSYKTRHAHKYALQRQARFDSLNSWGALPIIDFLPTLLHFSFFLFLLGLIVRLWLLDHIVAYSITAISVLGIVLYVGFVILGAAVGSCPYKARLSVHVKSIFSLFKRKASVSGVHATKQSDGENYAEREDLYALQWFLDHGRDPATITTACQALAGLKLMKLNPVHFNISSIGPGLGQEAIAQQRIKAYSTILKLGARVLDRLKAAPSKYYNELVVCKGANIARYAIALSEIYPHALLWIQQSHRVGMDEKKRNLVERMDFNASDIIGSVFHALDLVWEDKTPPLPFTTDSYIYLTIAELKIIRHALTYLQPDIGLPVGISRDHIAIAVSEAPGVVKYHSGLSPLADLQKRYNRALGRAALLIQDSFNISRGIPIASSTRMIHDTLSAIMELVTQTNLHSDRGVDEDLYTYDGEIAIPVATGAEYGIPRIISNRQGMRTGLLAGVMTLWGPGAEGPQRSREVEIVALNLMSKIGPDLMNHWATRYGQTPWPNFDQALDLAQPALPDIPEDVLTDLVISHLLEIANFTMLFLGRPNMYQLAEVALESLSCKADTQDGQRVLHEKLFSKPDLLILWIKELKLYNPTEASASVEDTSTNWVDVQFAKLLATQDSEGRTIGRSLLEHLLRKEGCGSEQMISVMKMMGAPQSSLVHTERLLHDIVDHVSTVSDSYPEILEVFTKSEGFDCLLRVGTSNPAMAARATIDIVMHLARSEKWIEQDAAYAFLQAVCVACNFPPQNWTHASNLFIPSTIRHLQRLQPSLERFAETNTIHTIDLALRRLKAEAEYMTIEQSKNKAIDDLTKITNSVQSRVRVAGPWRALPVIHTTPDAWAARLQAAQQPRKDHEGGRNDDARSMEEFHLQSARTSIHAWSQDIR